MQLVIEVDAFSGRSNWSKTFGDREARGLLRDLRPVSRVEHAPLVEEPSYLGYRGLILRQIGGRVRDLPQRLRLRQGILTGVGLDHHLEDVEFEARMLQQMIEEVAQQEHDVVEFLQSEFDRARNLVDWPWRRWVPPPWFNPCACAPQYEPLWWNDPSRQPLNNCYNYASNYRTDTFAQPGLAAGAEYASLACSNVLTAAEADDLLDAPGADNRCPPYGRLVALVIAPGVDFHWYRKGPDGLWSHKPGGTPAINLDNAGNPITDPRAADRGPYTQFCTFMIVMDGHIKIR